MQSIKAVYDGSQFKALEPIPAHGDCEVIITFLEEPAKPKVPVSELMGILKGKVWMADDFDAPLDELKEYM